MATGMDAYEEAVTPFKFELLRGARFEGGGEQSVLEIGIGAAPNLQYLTRASFQQVACLQDFLCSRSFVYPAIALRGSSPIRRAVILALPFSQYTPLP